MKIKALISFSGELTMHEGEITEYSDKAVLRDLMDAGYIEEVKKAGKNVEGKQNNKKTSG